VCESTHAARLAAVRFRGENGCEMRLGIDFGTTRTVVAAAVNGRYPVAVFETPAGFSDFVPGMAALSNETLAFGWEALGTLASGASGAVRSIKRAVSRLSPDDPLDAIGGSRRSALELTTDYLLGVRKMIVESSNLDVDPAEPLEAMIAVPANASTRQRYLTLEAFRRAGFRVLGMVNEPTAAAIEYAHRNLGAVGRRSPKRYVVVYDLGGGTFDTSAVSLAGRRFELIASEGISQLGGDDFDEIIVRLALDQAGLREAELPPVSRTRLLEACREAKEALSPSSRKMLIELGEHVPGAPAITLDLAEVYAETRWLVDRTLELSQRVFARLAEHGIDADNPRELGAVYVVGGATAFPAVGKALRELYKRKVQLAPQPHAATALGLAIAADPEAGLFVREAVTRHFGVWREADAGRDKVFDPIFGKGALPENGDLTISRSYRPVHAVGHLRFLECSELGEQGQPSGDLTPWGEILFPYDPALCDHGDLAPLAQARRPEIAGQEIVETYRYGRDGKVTVAIQNRTHGYERRFVLGQA
jgi:molecular chaperone DnaK (HSP70)